MRDCSSFYAWGIEKAIARAKESSYVAPLNGKGKKSTSSYKLGAVLAVGRNIISTGTNQNKTHPYQDYLSSRSNRYCFGCDGERMAHRNWVHAELDCLRKIDVAPSRSTLFIARVLPGSNIHTAFEGTGMARPCAACLPFVKQKRIFEICYTTGDGIAVESFDRHF